LTSLFFMLDLPCIKSILPLSEEVKMSDRSLLSQRLATLISMLLGAILLSAAVAAPAFAACSAASCTATSAPFTLSATGTQPKLDIAPPLTISGLSGSVSKVTVTLARWTGGQTDSGGQLNREFFLAYAPASSSTTATYEFLCAFGSSSGFSNVTVTLDDDAIAGHSPENLPGSIPSNASYTFLPTVPNNSAYRQLPSTGPIASNNQVAPESGHLRFGLRRPAC
jgi:hypothetical protein